MSHITVRARRIVATLAIGAMLAIPFGARAAIINPILGLDIGGTLYDVTFHDQAGDTFNALWDQDDDGVFGGGTSLFSAAPTFWNDLTGAEAARDAVIVFLGATNQSTATSDGFFVPIGGQSSFFLGLIPGPEHIASAFDISDLPAIDGPGLSDAPIEDGDAFFTGFSPFTSFSPVVSGSAPAPVTPALLISALIPLVAMRRHRAKQAA